MVEPHRSEKDLVVPPLLISDLPDARIDLYV